MAVGGDARGQAERVNGWADWRRCGARVDPSNLLVPFPSSTTGTELGLIDARAGDGTWTVA